MSPRLLGLAIGISIGLAYLTIERLAVDFGEAMGDGTLTVFAIAGAFN